ncbi:hypothetical protein AK812_SmicGene45375 [Symbiodinium microadriaticum]|uniref:Uncharacterized protein n=1 Tax=Symbiodinium microadriaticum TaxID=2951 RepID=A0A1Q9BW78_SYMMI|nr:hypothetical protein AK812_SmicGene45375 [Symbiodinium microadriaticum]
MRYSMALSTALTQELQKIDKELEKQTIVEEEAPAAAAEPAVPSAAAPAMTWKPKVAKPALVMLLGCSSRHLALVKECN